MIRLSKEHIRGRWIDFEKVLPPDFLKTQFNLVLIAPNGSGKTTSILHYVSKIRLVTAIERVYVTFITHEQSKKYLDLLSRYNAFPIVYYEGIERVCINKKLLEKCKKLGLPLSFACNLCPYNMLKQYNVKKLDEKHKVVAEIVREWLSRGIKIISVSNTTVWSWKQMSNLCTQPVIRHLVEFPQVDNYLRKKLVFVVPIQIFKSKSIVFNWRQYAKRQKRKRMILIFFDEADDLFYRGFEYIFAKPNFTKFDEEILDKISTVSYNFKEIIKIYEEIFKTLYEFYVGKLNVDNAVSRINFVIDKNRKMIYALHSRLSKICKEAFNRNEFTFIPQALENLLVLEKIAGNVVRTVDLINGDFILHDYDYAYQVLLNPEFPFRFCVKISATATLPSFDVMLTSRLVKKARKVLKDVKRVDIHPLNVWICYFDLFSERPTRNREIMIRVPKLLKYLANAFKEYEERINLKPRGMIVFLGNKKQFQYLYKKLKDYAYEVKEFYFKVKILGKETVFTYVSSPISRALDLDMYDISVVVAPLLRPPRRRVFYDILDIAKAVSDSIQSQFRIVRSLYPTKPKLLAFEKCFLLSSKYYMVTPVWFKKLVRYCLKNRMLFELTLEE